MASKANVRSATIRLTATALFMALNIAFSSFGVPVPGGHLYLNDIVICLASILLNPLEAFMVGGVGAFLGDLIFYPLPMFVSLITHGLQAVIISVFSHYVLKRKPVLASGIGVSLGAVIMVIGYTIGRIFIYGKGGAVLALVDGALTVNQEALAQNSGIAVVKLPYQIAQAVVGAVFGMLLCHKFGLKKLFHKMLG
ncbi:MAG TPA: ECF transporter S component [Ruminococcaceae bacterium]|nr:ECF transporter S component [Oscillospiraceae bacterium]